MPVQKRTNTARINDIGAWTGTMVEVIAAESHLDEAARVEALRALGVLDTQPEERFDRITRLATVLLDVPISLVSLVDDRRQWFKSNVGLAASETSKDIAFCTHAIVNGGLVVEDAIIDPGFFDNPLVTDDPSIRFYTGHPLRTETGLPLGTGDTRRSRVEPLADRGRPPRVRCDPTPQADHARRVARRSGAACGRWTDHRVERRRRALARPDRRPAGGPHVDRPGVAPGQRRARRVP